MARLLKAAAAQMGPIARSETRRQVVDRLLALLREGHAKGVKLLVYQIGRAHV